MRFSSDLLSRDTHSSFAPEESGATSPPVKARDIFALAFPALGVLAATPLYLLLDTAVVGRLGAVDLAALGAATTIQAQVTTQLTFLSYGTTARASRHFGAGHRDKAIAEGVQATWVAVVTGVLIATLVITCAPHLTMWLAGDTRVAQEATRWLHIAALGIPLTLMTMAGNGWLRGIQNTRSPLLYTLSGVIPGALLVPYSVAECGIIGSAWANLVGQTITSSLFVAALVRNHHKYRGSWKPQWVIISSQLVLGRDLIARSLSFQIAFISAAAVAARFGAAALAAHQILLQLWNFLTLALDALAIAAQTLVGAALGRGASRQAWLVGRRIVLYSSMFALGLAALFAAGAQVIPALFSSDAAVLHAVALPWWLLVGMIVVGGVVFAIDGVLLGAADAVFLRNITICAVVGGFLPGVWLSLWLDGGLFGVWLGLSAFLIIRLLAVIWRFRSGLWARGTGENQ